MKRRQLFFSAFFLVVLLMASCTKKEGAKELAVSVSASAIGLDVRTAEELKANPSPQSVHIPISELKQKIESKIVDKNKEILVFCEVGGRASQAKEILESLGFSNVKNIGSWRAWNKLNQK